MPEQLSFWDRKNMQGKVTSLWRKSTYLKQQASNPTKLRLISNKDQAQALMIFLNNDRIRHQRDIDRINSDIQKLQTKWGVSIDPAHVDTWWEI